MNVRQSIALALAFIATTNVSAAPADNAVIALIPPKTVAVVQVNGIERVQQRLDKLLKAAIPDRADEASRGVRDAIAEALNGRDLSGLRPDGRVLIAIADLEKLPDDATFTFLFPVTSAADFRSKFLTVDERKSLKKVGDLESVQWEDRKEPFFIANLKEYVAVCSDQATAQAYARGEIGGVAKQLSVETTRAFLDADISLFVNVRELSARFGEQLKKVKSLADLFLKGDTVQGVSKSQLDQLKGVIEAAFQVIEDGTAAVLAIEFRPDGIAMRGIAQFGEKTASNAALKKYELNPLPQVGTLPAGQTSYSASALNVPGSKIAELLTGTVSVEDADRGAKETIARLQKELAEYDRGIVLTAGKIVGAGLEVSDTKDAAKIVAARFGLLQALTKKGSFAKVPLKVKPEIQENAETLGGFTLHRAHLKFDFDDAVADLPEDAREAAKASLKRDTGGDETNVWIGTNGKSVLQLIGADWVEAKALAEAYLNRSNTLDKDPAYLATRKKLPTEASMVIALDAAQAASSFLDIFKGTASRPRKAAEPKAVVGKLAFVGLALILKPEHASFEIFVPAEAVDAIRRLVEPLLDNNK